MNKWKEHTWWKELLEGLLPELASAGIRAVVPPYKPGETPRLWVAPSIALPTRQPLAVDLEPLRRLQQQAEESIKKRTKKGNKRTRRILENELGWRRAMVGVIRKMLMTDQLSYTAMELSLWKLGAVVIVHD